MSRARPKENAGLNESIRILNRSEHITNAESEEAGRIRIYLEGESDKREKSFMTTQNPKILRLFLPPIRKRDKLQNIEKRARNMIKKYFNINFESIRELEENTPNGLAYDIEIDDIQTSNEELATRIYNFIQEYYREFEPEKY